MGDRDRSDRNSASGARSTRFYPLGVRVSFRSKRCRTGSNPVWRKCEAGERRGDYAAEGRRWSIDRWGEPGPADFCPVYPRHGSSPDLSLSDFPEIEPVSEAVRLPDGCGPPDSYFHEKCGLIL